nr:PLP-dependent aminotransferase family protein [Sinorhizobium meliloti]
MTAVILFADWIFGRSTSVKNERSNFYSAELPLDALTIDREGGESLQRQIYLALRSLILRRVLQPGLKLPSTRELAKVIDVSRNTIVAAYDQLSTEGYVETRQGASTYIVDLPPPLEAKEPQAENRSPGISKTGKLLVGSQIMSFDPQNCALRPSTPDVASFPFKTWNRLQSNRLRRQGAELFNYNFHGGLPALQAAISNYLQAYRGVRCEPDQIIITSGAQSALDLLSRLLLDPGDRVWMEDPGYVNAAVLFAAAGADIKPLPVSEKGWDLEDVPDGPIRLIYSTPSCQQPLGLTMLMEQRLRLLDIAYRKNAWIIEDDFDSEYRISGKAVPAMQGHDVQNRTIYVGTFAKTLFPAIRIGFMVIPRELSVEVSRAMLYSGHHVSLPLQATLADFIGDGHFARHLRRTRRLYSERRDYFLDLCRDRLGDWLEPICANVGIQIAFQFRQEICDVDFVRHATPRRLNLMALSRFFRSEPPRHGLLMGYAANDERSTQKYVAELSDLIGGYSPANAGKRPQQKSVS